MTREELLKLSENILIIDRAFRTGEIDERHQQNCYRTYVRSPWESFYVNVGDDEWDCICYSPDISTVDTILFPSEEKIELHIGDFDLSEEMLFQFSTLHPDNQVEAIFVKSYLDKYRNSSSQFYFNMCYYDEFCGMLKL